MSIFTFAIELWGCAYDGKYLSQIDKFIKRAHKNGYISKRSHIKEIRDKRDKKLWNKITSTENNALNCRKKEVGYLGLEGMLMNSP